MPVDAKSIWNTVGKIVSFPIKLNIEATKIALSIIGIGSGISCTPPPEEQINYSQSPQGPCFENLSEGSFRFACDTFMNGEVAKNIKCKDWHIYNYDAQNRVCVNRIFKGVDCGSNKKDFNMGPICLDDDDPQINQVQQGMMAKSAYFTNALINAVESYFSETAKLISFNDAMRNEFNGNGLRTVIEKCYENKTQAGFALFNYMKILGLNLGNQTTAWKELNEKSTSTDCTTPLLHAGALIHIVNQRIGDMEEAKKQALLKEAEEAINKSVARCPGSTCTSEDVIGALQKSLRDELNRLRGQQPPPKKEEPEPKIDWAKKCLDTPPRGTHVVNAAGNGCEPCRPLGYITSTGKRGSCRQPQPITVLKPADCLNKEPKGTHVLNATKTKCVQCDKGEKTTTGESGSCKGTSSGRGFEDPWDQNKGKKKAE
jgi:hypothetical protein